MQITIKTDKGVLTAEAAAGENLLQVLCRAGVSIPAPCGGNGTCGKCRVLVTDATGTSFRLACETEAAEDMHVAAETHEGLVVTTAGDASNTWGAASWHADGTQAGYGIAVDLGTTTIACCMVNRETGELVGALGAPNPQVVFGADVISRISAVGKGHLTTMSELVCEKICELIESLCKKTHIKPSDVNNLMVSGNTTMEHIFAGIDPTPIGISPFTPPTLFGCSKQLFDGCGGAKINDGDTYIAPCIAGYVGGDVVCDLVSINVFHQDAPVVILDLGTNGEMALGSKDGVITCATAAGPVFEGANTKFGMPAYNGAISRVSYQGEGAAGKVVCEVIGGGKAKGICGTGLIDAVALMLDLGVLDESGYLPDADEVPQYAHLLCEADDGSNAFMLADGIYITQKDIRCLQLAKSAVCAGILAMLEARGLKEEDVAALYIAGGFGEYLNLESASRIGLFPSVMLDCARSVGNACLQGEAALMCSRVAHDEMKRIASESEYMELSTCATFNEIYVDSMPFPEE